MKIATALPKGVDNGLVAIDRALVNDPEDVHLVIAQLDCKSITTDTDTGDTEPTIRILKIEVVPKEALDTVQRVMTATYGRRTGDNPLFDLATASGVYASRTDVDEQTGEIHDGE